MFDQFNQESELFTQEPERCECLDHEPEAFDRLPLFLPLIVVMFVSYFFLLEWDGRIYGLLIGSVIPFTAFATLCTFGAVRGQRPYFFECTIVSQTMPRLARRHVGFLIVVMVVESIAFFVNTRLSASGFAAGRGGSSSSEVLSIPLIIVAMVEIWTNRSLLERAHQQAFPESTEAKAQLG
jgi:hypothetical protein